MTAVYSKFPVEIEHPIKWLAAWRAQQRKEAIARMRGEQIGLGRENYPALPWTMEELVGSVWVNVHTGHLETISSCELASPKYRPREGKSLIVDAAYNSDSHRDTIGFYSSGRYIIEHWIRYDLLPASVQLEWLCIRLSHVNRDIDQHERELDALDPIRTSCYKENKRLSEMFLRTERENRARAIEAIRQFAEQHDLPVPMDIINADQVGQLALC